MQAALRLGRLEVEVLQEVPAQMAKIAELRLGVLFHVCHACDGRRELLLVEESWVVLATSRRNSSHRKHHVTLRSPSSRA